MDDLSSLSPAQLTILSDVVQRLRHDWIKYMEMRLLSIDWQHPPDNLLRLVVRGVLKTRKLRGGSEGILEIWQRESPRLAAIESPIIARLCEGLEEDLDFLAALAASPHDVLARVSSNAQDGSSSGDSGLMEAHIRRPGLRLSQVARQVLSLIEPSDSSDLW